MPRTIRAIAFATCALMAAPAAAADYDHYRPTYVPAPAARPYWQGPYVGLNLGYQWGDVSRSSAEPAGVFGGAQAGYSWQYGQFVFGGETDIQLSAAEDKFAAWQFSNPWFGTLRARAGLTYGNALFYGTVGLAYGTLTLDNKVSGVSESHTGIGWTAGGGVEMSLLANWTAKLEYLYVDLDSHSYVLNGTSNGITSSTLRIGVNYRF